MIKIRTNIYFCALLFLLASCSQILEPVEIETFTNEKKVQVGKQSDIVIKFKALTMDIATKQKNTHYKREVMFAGTGSKANVYSEVSVLKNNIPKNSEIKKYRMGVGDKLTFVQLQEMNKQINSEDILLNESNNISQILSEEHDKIISSSALVGSDGSILLLGLGRLDAKGRTINELRSDIRNTLIRKGLAPNFQLEVTGFNSSKAYIFGPGGINSVVPIRDRSLTLMELIASSKLVAKSDQVVLITLLRDQKSYKLSTEGLLDPNRSEIYIQDKDIIKLENLPYKAGQVYTITGSRNAKIVPINPMVRETLADILFMENGPLGNSTVKKSEIYLLRGQDPIIAYHLDAQKASRVLIAAAMELRPDDILYVAERPIISFSRLLAELSPLRNLLRDIKENDLP